jgi:hypothetical protein
MLAYLPGLAAYLAEHDAVRQSLTAGAAAAVAVLVGLSLRAYLRTALRPAVAAVASLDIVLWSMAAIVAVTVVERFDLLA